MLGTVWQLLINEHVCVCMCGIYRHISAHFVRRYLSPLYYVLFCGGIYRRFSVYIQWLYLLPL